MSAAGTTALDRLAERLDALAAARRRADELAGRRRRAHRIAAQREGELRAVYASADGGDPDPAEVERAREAVDRARAEADPAAWEGRDAGARRAVLEAEAEVGRFARERQAELVADLVPGALAAGERLESAWAELRAADRAYLDECQRWRPLLGAWELPPEELPWGPLNPLMLGLNDPDTRPPPPPWRPIPASLDPDREED